MMAVMEDREVWRLISSYCPCDPHGKAGKEEKKEQEEKFVKKRKFVKKLRIFVNNF